MLSYLTNRHYHLLTKELPEELRTQQPKVVYLPTYNSEKIDYKNQKKNTSKFKNKHSRQLQDYNDTPLGDCCPICFSIDNISVEFYGKKHICVKCRKLIRDEYGNQTRIFLDYEGEIVCLGIKAQNKNDESKKIYYFTDYTKLQINGKSTFATFAKPDEMVLILRLPPKPKQ